MAGLGLALGACGGGDDAEPAAANVETPSSPATGGNRAPKISGTPVTSVMQNVLFDMQPTASDDDGDALTFAIQGKPSWASFDTKTGRLWGTPTPADVGSYANIRISVSDGVASATLPAFTVQVVATATGSVTLTWTPPTQNVDGSPLTNLAGYRIYWGTSPGNYANSIVIDNPGIASYVIEQLTPAKWYFATSAVNSAGVESALSGEASKTVL